MDPLLIPQPDTIPVSWGWFQFLLLLTFPLHLLAMNAMIGGLLIGLVQHVRGGTVRKQLAHRIAIALPLVIAFVVNFGVAPLLFLQVLYGQFVYSSSVLMGSFWLLIVPVLIIAYYGAYLYDFKFRALRGFGPVLGIFVLLLLLLIGFFFSNNMLLMSLPERFTDYFSVKNGTLLVHNEVEFWPRYLHMMCGAIAIGGLFVGLLGKFKKDDNPALAAHSENIGIITFNLFTLVNICIGFWYFLSLPEVQRKVLMGGSIPATAMFAIALLLITGMLFTGLKKQFWLTFSHAVGLVFVMTFMRSWVRSSYLEEFFTLDTLQVIPEYSPMLFFFVTLLAGVACMAWLLKQTYEAMD